MTSDSAAVFLGANTALGYVFEQSYPRNGHTYILKGGPGCGQSLLLHQISQAAALQKQQIVKIRSPLSPLETDGILLPDSETLILDGSVNQILEPRMVGLGEYLVDLGQCLRTRVLAESRDEIVGRYHRMEELTARARRFLSAAGTLHTDSFHLTLGALDMGKAKRFAGGLAKRYFPAFLRKNAKPGEETRLFLSGFTGRGHLFLEGTIHAYADEILAIEDEHGTAARLILAILRQEALGCGLSVITCLCGLQGAEKIDHLIIPELSLAICTSNRYHTVSGYTRRYHLRRFADCGLLRSRKQRLSFNRRAAGELAAGACEVFAQVCMERRELETLYHNALDASLLEQITLRTMTQMGL